MWNRSDIDFAYVTMPSMNISHGNVTLFERLGLEDGLSQIMIYSLFQDSLGFLWVGTQDGLNKFDGYEFTVYRNDPIDPESISNNRIKAIFEDSSGNLWVGTDESLNLFDRKLEKFIRFPVEICDQRKYNCAAITAIVEDTAGHIWFGTEGGGLYKLDHHSGQMTNYRFQENDQSSLPNDFITSLMLDSERRLWIGTLGGGLCRFKAERDIFKVYRNDSEDANSLSSDNISAIFEDSQGAIWVGTKDAGVNTFIPEEGKGFVHFKHNEDDSSSLSDNSINALIEDGQGTLWIGTSHGLNEFDRCNEKFIRHYHRDSTRNSPPHNEVFSLLVGAQGILWVGTRTGIGKFDPATRAFGHRLKISDNPNELSGNFVSALFVDTRGTLWVGTYGSGLNKRISENPDQYIHYPHVHGDVHCLGDIHHLQDDDLPHEFGENGVYAIFEDSSGNLWLGTGAGLHKLIPGDNPDSAPTFERYQYKKKVPGCLSQNEVFCITEDREGNLWVGTVDGGLNMLPAGENKKFIHYTHDANDPQSLSDNQVRTLFLDSRGHLWVGTSAGLSQLVPGEKVRFIRYQHDKSNPNSLSNNLVASIAEDSEGNLWIGTQGGGINKFDRQSRRFIALQEKDGLSNNNINGVLVDEDDQIWVSTNKGINKYDPVNGKFAHYDTYDGVQADEFSQGAYCKDHTGQMYFGGINGFNQFYPKAIKENEAVPPVVLTKFLLANKPISISENGPLKQHINFADRIELNPEDYIFAFEFSALNYRQSHKNQYAYKLEGFDKDWIYTDANDRKAVYTNVPPGNYTFRVRASNDDGVWNKEGASVEVIVSQPWWQVLLTSTFEAVVIHDREKILEVNQGFRIIRTYKGGTDRGKRLCAYSSRFADRSIPTLCQRRYNAI